jgi:FAD/FMN-containing dehydrogenase
VQCDALIEAGLGKQLLFASDDEYDERIASWWALNSRLRPWCLVQPENTEQVSTVVTALLGAGNGAGDWHIAVRSGGHSLPSSNNIVDGVTIDLGKMNDATYDSNTSLASIQPGGRWEDVYAKLLKYDVMVAGGRDGDVGVGGFFLVRCGFLPKTLSSTDMTRAVAIPTS